MAATDKKLTKPAKGDYFVFPHPVLVVAILFGLWLLGISTFSPDRIPLFLGPLGDFARHLGKNYPVVCLSLTVMTMVVHCLEAAYAEKLCIDKQLSMGASVKWTLQTLIFGFASLIRLKPYSPYKKLS
ncbi:transmembrane protein 254-like [Haliotis cracherodii]|uniref:transmembrane protein 254-like n=1 Tax=Haliotis cracherodii TaxID=6455 RepID=UPI0039E98125